MNRRKFNSNIDMSASSGVPLCVDLDGTLIHTNMLYEAFFRILRDNTLYLFLMPYWLFKGKAYFKQKLAEHVDIDVQSLPYNKELLNFLREKKIAGRKLILATSTNEKVANKIAEYLNVFLEVVASDGKHNLSGYSKAELLKNKYGTFDYVGNSSVDIPVWRMTRSAIVVSNSSHLIDRVKKVTTVDEVFGTTKNSLIVLIKEFRCYQWVKNLLVFVPLLTSHTIFDIPSIFLAFSAFLAFSLCSSSVYVLNDLLDLEADRNHSQKCLRPFASGRIPLAWGIPSIVLLLMCSVFFMLFLPFSFAGLLGIYYLFALLYSFQIKKILLLDVFLLAGLYTLRIVGGCLATTLSLSPWLLTFSMFFFLSLAFLKRYSELLMLHDTGRESISGRGYMAKDSRVVFLLGIASGYVSVLVFALYINSDVVSAHYKSPIFLWVICPLLLYWISHIWLSVKRKTMDIDPILFTLKDMSSYLIGLLVLFFLALGVFGL